MNTAPSSCPRAKRPDARAPRTQRLKLPPRCASAPRAPRPQEQACPSSPRGAQPRLGSASAGTSRGSHAGARPAVLGLTRSRGAPAPPPHTRKWRAHGNGPRGTGARRRRARGDRSSARSGPSRPVRPAVQGSGAVPGNAARSRRGVKGGGEKGRVTLAGRASWRALSGRAPAVWTAGRERGRPVGRKAEQRLPPAPPAAPAAPGPAPGLLSQVALRGQLAIGARLCHPLPSVGALPGVSAPPGCPPLPAESRSGGRPGVPAAKGPVSLF